MWKNLLPAWAKSKSSAVMAEEVELLKKVPVTPPPSEAPPSYKTEGLLPASVVEKEVHRKHELFMVVAEGTFQRASRALSSRPVREDVAAPLPGVMIGRRVFADGSQTLTCIYQPQLVVHEEVGPKSWDESQALRRLDGEEDVPSLVMQFTSRIGKHFDPELPLNWTRLE